MATSFRYLIVDVDGEVQGTSDEAVADYYSDGDFLVIKSADLPEAFLPDEDEG